MRNFTLLIISLLLTLSGVAQTPGTFNYQAVIRDASGGIMPNKEVLINVSIVQGSESGTVVYTEDWNVKTNDLGLVNLAIGSNDPQGFDAINWMNGPYYMSLNIDGEYLGTSPLLSVPYALLAQRVVEGGTNDADADPTNELQDLSISGHQLTISGGSTVTLPDNTRDADSDPTNEIELPVQAADDTNKSLVADGAGNVSWQAGSVDTKLSEADVDAFVANNGYQLSADDGDTDATNEIQDLNLTGDILKITANASATAINLAVYKDNTDNQTLNEILTSSTSAGNHTISDLVDPTAAQEAATKKYVDDQLLTKVDAVTGKVLSSNDYTNAEKAKLAGAEITASKNAINGYAGLDANKKIDIAQLPAITVNNVYSVTSEVDQLALSANQGDVAIRTDISKNYIHNGGTAGDMTDWSKLASPSVAVTSVNGKTGAVVIGISDIATLQSSLDAKLNVADVAAVATSGNYEDLSGIPINLDTDKTDDLLKSDLVNNLVDGGTNKALTAEQGKQLKIALDSKISSLDVYTKLETNDLLDNKVTVISGKVLSSNDYTNAEKAKLAGAEITARKNAINGYAGLDANKKIDIAQLPAITVNNVYTVTSDSEQLALSANQGDVAIRTDISKNYIHNGGTAGDMTDWSELASPSVAVTSVNGKTGAVVIGISDIATLQSTLDAKAIDADLAAVAKTGDYADLTGVPANIDVDKTDDLLKSDLVNDLITGGTTKALTAEQGKALKGLVDVNSAKVGITAQQAAVIAATSGTNTGDQDISGIATNATAIATKVTANTAITGATKTKITYDAKGLVTGGTDATTADIAASTDKNYVSDAQLTVIAATSGTNTGDQNISGIATNATAIATKVTANTAITGATKTKITYDAKGLVTGGTDATTADIAASTDKNYVTDAQLTLLGNTSGTNTGDITLVTTSHDYLSLSGQAITLGAIDLAADVTGTLPIANGGTGATTASTAFNALAPAQTGNSGKYLTTDGSTVSWANATASALSQGKILIGNASGIATEQTVSGDVTISEAGVTAIGTGKVTNDMLAGSITNDNLANSSVTIGSTNIALGGTSTTLAGLTTLEASGPVTIGSDAATPTAGSIVLEDATGSNTFQTSFTAGAQSADIDYTLPIAAPTAGQVLSSDASGVMSWTTVAGGLTNWTGSASGDGTIKYSSVFTPNSTQTNVDAVLTPKGTGALVAQASDGTNINNRGDYAVDLQMNRIAATQVASGNKSVIAGGTLNTASGTASTVLGGGSNTASGGFSTVLGGIYNTASGDFSSVAGYNNTASGNYSSVAGAYNTSGSYGETVLGYYAEVPTATSATSPVSTDRLFAIGNGSSESRNDALTILKNGNVGIGTTTPGIKLEVNTATGAVPLKMQTGTEAWQIGQNAGTGVSDNTFGFYSETYGTAHDYAPIMTLTNTGNVGIGTTSPTAALTLKASSNTDAFRIVQDNEENYGFSLQNDSNNGYLKLNRWAGGSVGSTLMTVSTSGNVGIGTTEPAYKLSVEGGAIASRSGLDNNSARPAVGAARIAGEIAGLGPNNDSDDGFLRMSAGGGTTASTTKSFIDLSGYSLVPDMFNNIVFGTSGSERMRIDNSGKVGIGKTAPAYDLDVNGAINGTSLLINGTPVGTSTSSYWSAGTSGAIYYSGGNVGIGTTSPDATLHVYKAGAGDGHSIIESEYGSDGGRWTKAWLNRKDTYDNWYGLYISSDAVDPILVAKQDGNVGIGTKTPTEKLDVNGTLMANALKFDANAYLQMQTLAGSTADVVFAFDADDYLSYERESNYLQYVSGGTERLRIDANGYVGIGTATPTHLLELAGGAYCDGTGGWITGSDRRLKRDIQLMTNYGLKEVLELQPVSYYYKADTTNHHEVGLIAQDVQKIIPEVVSGKEGDISKGETLGIAYGNLVPVLTKAIQEQQAQIDELKAQNAVLTQKADAIDQLKAEVENLKKMISTVGGQLSEK